MTTLLLVRHGATDAVGKRLTGRKPGIRLNAEGALQTAHLARRLSAREIAAVYSSPLERAVETARAIALPHGLEPKVREGLTEIEFGAWSGMPLAELEGVPSFRTFNSFRSGSRPPGGEHMLEVQLRMLRELEQIEVEHPNATVVVVGHADPLKAAIAYFIGLAIDLTSRIEISPASVSIVKTTPEGVTLQCLNDTGNSGPNP